jgi:RNA polymerase sigma-70 factor (ECF subfamily)
MQESDHLVVRAVVAGDMEAYGALVRAHSETVFRVAFGITGNEADAEEIVDLSDRRQLRPKPSKPTEDSG